MVPVEQPVINFDAPIDMFLLGSNFLGEESCEGPCEDSEERGEVIMEMTTQRLFNESKESTEGIAKYSYSR